MPRLNRRRFLSHGLVAGIGGLTSGFLSSQTQKTQAGVQPQEELSGQYRPVHDPCIIKEDGTYYLFCTGTPIPIRTSSDLVTWELAGGVFESIPEWASEQVPGVDSLWAPDISYFNDRYHLYYSVSTFGSNHSRIGLVTTPTLNPDADDHEWTDHGPVISSERQGNYNAIDPNVTIDQEGIPWLSFGSFWSGIKMRRLDYETGMPSEEDTTLYDLATRFVNSRSVEAPFIIRKDDYYYLFVSFDFCCRGFSSTYRVMVGRSESVTGPYIDRDGTPMLEGGGTQVTFPTSRWRGPGHNAVLQEDDRDYLVYHAYDATLNGMPSLRIQQIEWDDEGWPLVSEG